MGIAVTPPTRLPQYFVQMFPVVEKHVRKSMGEELYNLFVVSAPNLPQRAAGPDGMVPPLVHPHTDLAWWPAAGGSVLAWAPALASSLSCSHLQPPSAQVQSAPNTSAGFPLLLSSEQRGGLVYENR